MSTPPHQHRGPRRLTCDGSATIPAGTTGCEPAPANRRLSAVPPRRRQGPRRPELLRAAPPRPPRPNSWRARRMLKVTAPLPLHVYIKGRLVGTTRGRVDDAAAGNARARVRERERRFPRSAHRVDSGRAATSSVKLDPPTGTLHINAVPWAEVWIDGERIGDTPIGNLQTSDWQPGDRVPASRFRRTPDHRDRDAEGTRSISMDLRKK